MQASLRDWMVILVTPIKAVKLYHLIRGNGRSDNTKKLHPTLKILLDPRLLSYI